MASRPPGRSVKIGEDERTGFSSDRPAPTAAAPGPLTCGSAAAFSPRRTACATRPGACCSSRAPRRPAGSFLDRLIEDRASLLSRSKVLALLAGRVSEEEISERADELLRLTAGKRLENRQTVVIGLDDMSASTRAPFLAMAAALRRPRHLILLEVSRELVEDEDLGELNELRRALDAGELGAEGIQTALRLGGGTAEEVKRILFRPPPREEP